MDSKLTVNGILLITHNASILSEKYLAPVHRNETVIRSPANLGFIINTSKINVNSDSALNLSVIILYLATILLARIYEDPFPDLAQLHLE